MCSGKYNITKKRLALKEAASGQWWLVIRLVMNVHPFPTHFLLTDRSAESSSFAVSQRHETCGSCSELHLHEKCLCPATRTRNQGRLQLTKRSPFTSSLLQKKKTTKQQQTKKKKERIVCTFRKSFCIHSVLAFAGDEWEICSHWTAGLEHKIVVTAAQVWHEGQRRGGQFSLAQMPFPTPFPPPTRARLSIQFISRPSCSPSVCFMLLAFRCVDGLQSVRLW